MKEPRMITAPLSEETVKSLAAGDMVLLSGVIYTARDAAHKRMMEVMDRGEKLPFELKGAVIYYAGPTPTPPGKVIGSVGPTTSGRMDVYTPRLIEAGLRGMIGKGTRSPEVVEACANHGAVYLAAIGGAGALTSKSVTAFEVIAWEDLGPEAVRRLTVKEMPLMVINDAQGRDLYQEGRRKYQVG